MHTARPEPKSPLADDRRPVIRAVVLSVALTVTGAVVAGWGLPGRQAVLASLAVGAGGLCVIVAVFHQFAGDYRSRRWLSATGLVLFTIGFFINTYVHLVSGFGVPPWVSVALAAGASVGMLLVAWRWIARGSRDLLGSTIRSVGDQAAADRMYRDTLAVTASDRRPLGGWIARLNGSTALITRSTSGDFADGLLEADRTLRELLADPAVEPVHVYAASVSLVNLILLKASKHGDVTGFAEALDLLESAAQGLGWPPEAKVEFHRDRAIYFMVMVGQVADEPGADPDSLVESACSELRAAITAATPRMRRVLPDLYATLASYRTLVASEAADLDEAIALCRTGRRFTRWWLPSARSSVDRRLAELIHERCWETVLADDFPTAGPALRAAEAAVRRDLRRATRLLRVAARHSSGEGRLDALELIAQIRATSAVIYKKVSIRRMLAPATAWHKATQVTGVPVDSMIRAAQGRVEWAVGTGGIGWSASAYGHLMSLVPRALTDLYLSTERERVLAGLQHTAEEAGYWLAEHGQTQQAAVALELGRAVGLTEVIGRSRPQVAPLLVAAGRPDLLTRYEEAVRRYNAPGAGRPGGSPAEAQRRWVEYDTVLREIAEVVGDGLLVTEITFADLTAAAADGPVVYLAAAERAGYAIVVGGAGEAIHVPLPDLTRARVREQLDIALGRPDRAAVAATVRWLWENGIEVLAARLPARCLATFVPVGLVGLLPVHAAGGPPWRGAAPADWDFLADRVVVRYAPNCRALRHAQDAAAVSAHDRPPNLLAVDAPDVPGRAPLRYAPTEGRLVARAWDGVPGAHTILHDATTGDVLLALPDASVWHFACHCDSVPERILDSALILADGRLTLATLLDMPSAPRRLAVLSGCRSHRSGRDLPDEATGLPSGLVQIGFAGVVASNWDVDDRAAVFLMSRFYDGWRRDGLDPAHALAEAQDWVRQASHADLHAYLPELVHRPADALAERSDWAQVRPFDHPRDWAAFALTGV